MWTVLGTPRAELLSMTPETPLGFANFESGRSKPHLVMKDPVTSENATAQSCVMLLAMYDAISSPGLLPGAKACFSSGSKL